MVRAPHERTEGKADPSRSPAAGRKQPPASGHSMRLRFPEWSLMPQKPMLRLGGPVLRY